MTDPRLIYGYQDRARVRQMQEEVDRKRKEKEAIDVEFEEVTEKKLIKQKEQTT